MIYPGRNDPCPCGSGKKFKRCCGIHGALSDWREPGVARTVRDPQAVRLAEAQQSVQSGNALSAQGHIHQAIAHYERALTLKPDYAVAHYNLGFALAAQGKAEQAVMHYERAVALNPNFTGSRLHVTWRCISGWM